MKTLTRNPVQTRRALIVALFIVGLQFAGVFSVMADDAEKKDETAAEEPLEYNNWIEFSLGGVFVSGDGSKFQQRHQIPAGQPFGGIEDFHWEQYVGERGIFKIDGRAIFDNNDYLLKMSLEDPDKGFVRFGYREFRTWYDGTGGYFPVNDQLFTWFGDEMFIDRGEVWFEAGLTLPDKPVVIFRYTHLFRDGKKDSTVWGDSTLTGGAGNRKIVPGFWDIDETRDIFELDVRHLIQRTAVGLGVRAELVEQDNTRNMRRNQGEANNRFISQREGVDTDLFNVRGFTETRFTERVLFTTGASFTTIDTDIFGSRLATPAGSDAEFFALDGGAQLKQYVANVNLMLTPCDDFTIVPSLRVEHQAQDGFASFIEGGVGQFNDHERSFLDVSERLELRYTGVKNWVFSTRAEWLQGQGKLEEMEVNDVVLGTLGPFRETDSDRFVQKYVAGANWYPHRRVNMGAQYYHKRRNNDYDHDVDSTLNTSGNRYPAFLTHQDFTTDDVNFRVTLRPCNNVTLVSRYDFQLTTIDTKGAGLSEVESGETTSHIFGQSITWVPLTWLYLQGNGSYVIDRTETPANDLTGAATDVVLESQNDYWMANASVGLALDQKTDLQATYFYYRSDNYVNKSATTLPYGADAVEHGVTLALSRQITKSIRATVKTGYFNHQSKTYGGHNDYDAYLLYASVQYRF